MDDIHPELECDLVMKGGVTSGVIYPGAVLELAQRYRFVNIGGSSAGAIAAAVTAAAEFRRREGGAGMPGLTRVVDELSGPGFLAGLFQPTPQAKPLMRMFLAALEGGVSFPRRALRVARIALRHRPLLVFTAAILTFSLGATIATLLYFGSEVVAFMGLGVGIPMTVALWITTVGFALWSLIAGARRSLASTGFGICTGLGASAEQPALTDWLHEMIQFSAGRNSSDPPLTFRDLAEREIYLRLTATDLSYGLPETLPMDNRAYLFDAAEMRKLFPSRIVDHMLEFGGCDDSPQPPPDQDDKRPRYLPTLDLPVLVAARISAALPFLLSAVPLISVRSEGGEMLEATNWFSDGGICSNFPVHFFDAWVPSRPTFAIDLQPFPEKLTAAPHEHAIDDVQMETDPRVPRAARWKQVTGTGTFLREVLDTMQNWRDSMQAGLPGFRDRICEVRLHSHEGGLNLNMPSSTIERLVERGRNAGRAIVDRFDWPQHRFTRYLTLMETLEIGLRGLDSRFVPLKSALRSGDPMAGYFLEGHGATWCRRAARETDKLLAVANAWRAPFGFDIGVEPLPTPVMRIVPRT